MNDQQFEAMCDKYFAKVAAGHDIKTNADTVKARDMHLKSLSSIRMYKIYKGGIKSPGPDIISNFAIDQIAKARYVTIPLPEKKQTMDIEYHFLIFRDGGKYHASRVFTIPANGGYLNYSCQLGSKIDWTKVVAAGHTHPFYKGKPTVNRLNRYFSGGDPTVLLQKRIPLYLRAPQGKDIKVLEIRGGRMTSRELGGKAKIINWKARD